MSGSEAQFRRWLLIVREHCVAMELTYDRTFNWRQQFRDGQKPLAAIRAYKRTIKK